MLSNTGAILPHYTEIQLKVANQQVSTWQSPDCSSGSQEVKGWIRAGSPEWSHCSERVWTHKCAQPQPHSPWGLMLSWKRMVSPASRHTTGLGMRGKAWLSLGDLLRAL